MRLALVIAILSLLGGGDAWAQSKPRPRTVPAAPAQRTPPQTPPGPALPDLKAVFMPPPVASSPVGGGPQQCRLSCAQSYYFCLSSDHPDDCPGAWGQCRAGCDAPALPTSY